ncbi:MAG: hypothetical protein IPL23_02585 [Saprospiraceae bacterium]|nr:hypothetical protein [Saprospiraceae bacterium]
MLSYGPGYIYMRMIRQSVLLGGARNNFLNADLRMRSKVNPEITINYLEPFLKKFSINENFEIDDHELEDIILGWK